MSAGLTLGLLDAVRASFSLHAALLPISGLLAIGAATTAAGVVPLGLAYAVLAVGGRRMDGARLFAFEIAAFVFLFALLLLVPPATLPPLRPRAVLRAVPGLTGPVLAALVSAAIGHRVVLAMQQSKDHRDTPAAIVATLPFLLFVTCLFSWLGWLRWGAGTRLTGGILSLLFFAVLIATAASVRRLGRRWLAAGLGLLVLGTFGGALAALREPPVSSGRQEPGADGEGRIRRVILLTVDTLRADALSCYGGGSATPVMDALAADGFRFTAARSPAPWTLPAVASLLTGVSPSAHGMTKVNHVLPDSIPTLAELLRNAGYRTAAIGENPLLTPDRQLSRGFDHYDFFPRAELPQAHGTVLLHRAFGDRFHPWAPPDRLTRLASEWIRAHAEEDFLLWVHYFDPHVPYEPPPRHRPEGPAPPKFGFRFNQPLEVAFGVVVPTLAEREWIRRLYDGEVRFVDESLGELVATLKELSIYDDSLIVLTSDHGEEFWEHGSYFHGHSLYGELLNVPLIVKLPGGAPKGTVEETVSLTAITPTILELAGIEADLGDASVASLAPLLRDAGGAAAPPEPVISEAPKFFTPRVAIESNRRKYIRDLVTDREEIYDLSRDPHEARSIADSVQASAREEMLAFFEAHLESSRSYRDALGDEDQSRKLDPVTLEKLRALGYTQ